MEKQEIIEEIKRTAKLNNGKALGEQRFKNETGIKKNDWFPHYWFRWGDAVKEAGLIQNQYITAINTDDAIEKLINLIKELGHFPIEGEMLRKKKQDSTFPHSGVLRSKFGNKKNLAAAVVKYCQTRDGFDDVIEICSEHLGEDEPTLADDAQTEQAEGDGFVYLMKSGRYYKIGRTDAVGRRHNEIKTQMPDEVEVVHHIRTDDPSGIEAYWHKRFTAKRKNGEWFDLSRTDINAFKRRKKFM
jgi:hypothetical protein